MVGGPAPQHIVQLVQQDGCVDPWLSSISSSCDISSGAGTPRSNYDHAAASVINTPRSTNSPRQNVRSRTHARRNRDRTPSKPGRRSGQSGLADPPALIPALIIEENLEQASQLQTL